MAKAYWLDYDAEEYCEEYLPVLKGPDDFECMLGEPEDSTWVRDGGDAIGRLNSQHDKIECMRGAMQEFVDRCDAGKVRSKYTYAKFKNILAA